MQVKQLFNPQGFKDLVADFLIQDEDINNLPLGIIFGLQKGPQDTEPFMAVVSEQDSIQLVMVKTTSHLVLSTSPNLASVKNTIDYIIKNDIHVPTVIGPKEVADEFVRVWEERGLSKAKVDMAQRIYRLDIVNAVPRAPGFMRLAQSEELGLVTQWVMEFGAEAMEKMSHEQARKLAEGSIDQQSIYIWENGQPVAMAKKSRPTKNGVVINLVYTPPKFRRKGYATSCVAGLSQQLLAEGFKFCCLYTDLSNPTSNKIYMNIGYQPVADSVVYKL